MNVITLQHGKISLTYLFLYHAEFFVHCFEMISVEARSVKGVLEVSETDLAHWLHDAGHERCDGPGGEVDNLGADTRGS